MSLEYKTDNNSNVDMHVISKMSDKDKEAAHELIADFFELHKSNLRGYSIRCLKNGFYLWGFNNQDANNFSQQEVEDVLQVVLTSLLTTSGPLQIDDQANLLNYIHKAIARESYRFASKKATYERTHVSISSTSSKAEAKDWDDFGLLDPIDTANEIGDQMMINRAIDLSKKETSLGGKFFEAFRMNMSGYGSNEIAKIIGVEAGAIRIAMFRFRDKLRSELNTEAKLAEIDI